jgi:hypothetical protein
MRTRFYKVTITDGHLTKCVVIPAKNLKSAKSELQKGHTKVVAVAVFWLVSGGYTHGVRRSVFSCSYG